MLAASSSLGGSNYACGISYRQRCGILRFYGIGIYRLGIGIYRLGIGLRTFVKFCTSICSRAVRAFIIIISNDSETDCWRIADDTQLKSFSTRDLK